MARVYSCIATKILNKLCGYEHDFRLFILCILYNNNNNDDSNHK